MVGGSTKISPDPLAAKTAACAIPADGTGPLLEKHRIIFLLATLLFQFSIKQALKNEYDVLLEQKESYLRKS
jgi:hypothetical protein